MPMLVKTAQALFSPSFMRRELPSTYLVPPLPMTAALTMRGDVAALDGVHGAQRAAAPSGPPIWDGRAAQRTPVVQRAVVVVGVVHALEVRVGCRPTRCWTSSVCPPEHEKYVATMGLPSYVGADARGAACTAASVRSSSMPTPDVGLVADVAVDVPRLAGLAAAERERARRARLRLERLARPARRHLVRHHAAQVALQRHVVDHHEPAAVHDPDRAAVGAVVAEVRLGDEAERARWWA